MINFVQSTQVLGANGVDTSKYNFLTGVVSGGTVLLPTVNTISEEFLWRIPRIISGLGPNGYSWLVATNSIRPTPDSQKVLRLKNGRNTWDIAVADTDGVGGTNVFGTLADGLGGSLASMPVVTITFPLIQDAPVTTVLASPPNTPAFLFSFPLNPLGLTYSIPWAWFNNAPAVVPYAPAGITTAAQFVTWANANWGTYGFWASSGNTVTLSSEPTSGIYVTKCGFNPQLTHAAWCIDASAFYPSGQIATSTLNSGGTGYAVGNQVYVNTGLGNAILTVATAPGGVVRTYTLTFGGSGYATATGVSTTNITGTGTGLTINITGLQVAASSAVNGIQFGSGSVIPFPAMSLNNAPASLQQLINSIAKYFEASATLAIGGSNNEKISISTILGIVYIYNNSTIVVSSSAGACS